ncbi:tyrosine--tRNA ligase [Candidatus Woesearchaeota archaeon]|nr:tyrosine--tRNA ligase [Candidatus Woesearchaeota archaeon]
MNSKERFDLVARNTAEILTREELRKLLEEKKSPIAYVGYAPTGRLHAGHLIPILKIGDFLKAGFKFKFLIANLHAHLDDRKSPWHLLDARSIYYEEIVKGVFESLKIDTSGLGFIRGSDFQLTSEYISDVLRMSTELTTKRALHSASEVCRIENPKVSTLIYPIMQALDEQYLDVDVQYGGMDQRKILVMAREYLPKLSYKSRVEVMTPLLPGLTGGKMSASDAKSKIDLLDDEKEVARKVNSAYCKEGEVKDNGVLAFCEYFLFPYKGKLKIERAKRFGGDINYNNFSELKKDFAVKKLHPMDLKQSVSRELNTILEPVRRKFEKKEKLLKEAYP